MPQVQKRPRGRPRKNPQPRPASPPPVVDYPFPQFPQGAAAGQVIPQPLPMPDGPTAGQAMFKLNMAVGSEEGAEGKEPEKKKPIMACLFCRERKIACGPPQPGGPQRCK